MLKTIIEDDKIIVFLNKDKIKNIDFKDEEKLEDYFKSIFLNLNKKYDIELSGYYNINIYKDNNYGAIIEMENDDLDYYNYFNQIDMKINISHIPIFLYEIEYSFLNSNILKNVICYKYLDKLYLKILDVDKCDFFQILEFSNIIYGGKVDEVLNYGKKVKL